MLSISAIGATLSPWCCLAPYSVPLLGLFVRASSTLQQQLDYCCNIQPDGEACRADSSSSSNSTANSQLAARSAAWHTQKVSLRLPSTGLLSAPAAAGFSTITSSSASTSAVITASSSHAVPTSDGHSLEACLNFMQQLASGVAGCDQDWLGYFRHHQRTGAHHWVCAKCGEWEGHSQGWTGPALALLQLWPVSSTKDEPDTYDYMLWELNNLGLPTGKAYTSTSAFETLTSRKDNKRASDSITVLEMLEPNQTWKRRFPQSGYPRMGLLVHDNPVAGVRLKTWLKQNLGVERTMGKSFSLQKGTYTPSEDTRHPKSWLRSGTARQSKGQRRRDTPTVTGISRRRSRSAAALTASEAAATTTAAEAAIAAASKAGPAPEYLYPGPPAVQSTQLHMAEFELSRRAALLSSIKSGQTDLSQSHIPLSVFMPEYHEVPAHIEQHPPTAAAASHEASGTGPHALHQVYRLEDLEQRAVAAEAAQQWQWPADSSLMPVVPDATRPFTITITNGKAGHQYVVAHYEPDALKEEQQVLAAQLCTIFHNRGRSQRIERTSAARHELMVMSGTRTPFKGGPSARYGRYHGDTDLESDSFAANAWPFLRLHGRFPVISRFWTHKLAKEVQQQNIEAAKKAGNKHSKSFELVNYPSPCLLGSPFTSLGITQNYHSKLHCEPGEHPFSFITWQDLLCPGARMEVGYFWLTAGLAFLPQPGSALYIDVRIVTHRSESCVVTNRQLQEEGRYGCALFIKPPVLKKNAALWAQFDAELQRRQLQRRSELIRQHLQENEKLLAESDVSFGSSDDNEPWPGQ